MKNSSSIWKDHRLHASAVYIFVLENQTAEEKITNEYIWSTSVECKRNGAEHFKKRTYSLESPRVATYGYFNMLT